MLRGASFSLGLLVVGGCFVDAFGPEGGGGSTSTEGAGATGATSAGGDGVGASGAQSSGGASSGGASSGGSGGVGASSAGGGGTDPSGGGGSGGGPCNNHFLRFDEGDSASLPFVAEFNEQNDLAFGGRLRVGDHPGFAALGKQRAGVFGSFGFNQETKGWRLVVEEEVPGSVRIVAEVYLSSMVYSVASRSLPTGVWHDVRVSYKKDSNPDLRLYVGDVSDTATPVDTLDPGNFDLETFTHEIHFGAGVGNDLAYVGELDDPYFKKGEEGFAMCAGGGSATLFRFDFETDMEPMDGIDDDCDDSIVMQLDQDDPPELACE
jgi:hypothetical protein